jgi:bifunctional DNA-binding transcriptional regulator/antitoxin component of YhaV-PrlF toxin-antitoxin module
MANKDTAKLSRRFQISIPKSVRAARRWQAGQVFAFIPKGHGVLPVPALEDLAGVARRGGGRLPRPDRPGLMRLVATSAWAEYLAGSALGARLASDFPDRTQWLVPTMVQLQLGKRLTREVDAGVYANLRRRRFGYRDRLVDG